MRIEACLQANRIADLHATFCEKKRSSVLGELCFLQKIEQAILRLLRLGKAEQYRCNSAGGNLLKRW